MNDSQINGEVLGGSSVMGNNATCTGGIASACVLAAGYFISAILSGGISSDPSVGGRTATLLQGGCESTSTPGGIQFITSVLRGGISKDCEVGSLDLGFSPSTTGGVESDVSFGGQLRTHVRLQTEDTLGFLSIVGGLYKLSHGLTGGVYSTGYPGGGIRGGTVLISDGIKSNSVVSGTIYTGRALSGGVYSDEQVQGKLRYPAILSGGILATHEVGKELDIEAILKGGAIQVGELSPHPMRIGSALNSGMGSNTLFNAKIILSPNSNGGVSSNATFDSKYKISAKLHGSLASSSVIASSGITASQRLQGGVESTESSDAKLRTHVRLQGVVNTSSNSLGGDIVEGFHDPLLNTWALEIRSATVLLEIFTPESDI
jgi:hypothetical protein